MAQSGAEVNPPAEFLARWMIFFQASMAPHELWKISGH